jgi:rubredoxin
LVVAFDDIKPDKVKRTASNLASNFFRATIDTPDAPSAYLNQGDPGHFNSAHFHVTDQFQVVVAGKGKFGRHNVSPYYVHFSRAHTPYGPLQVDEETGWAFLTLRARFDPGQQRLPAALEKLKQIPHRRPWQVSKTITFPRLDSGISLEDVPEIKDDQGLFVRALTMAPRTRTVAPDPSGGDGQFVVVVQGSLVHETREAKALTVAFVKPVENAFLIEAGANGLQALVLNLPQVKPRATSIMVPSAMAGFKKWQCVSCSFAYDEALGLPEEGIRAGTRWEDVPETWTCPDCATSKSEFEMVEV